MHGVVVHGNAVFSIHVVVTHVVVLLVVHMLSVCRTVGRHVEDGSVRIEGEFVIVGFVCHLRCEQIPR